MNDWASYLLRAEKYLKKASDDLIASQSVPDGVAQAAKRQATEHLLEAIASCRDCLGAIRE